MDTTIVFILKSSSRDRGYAHGSQVSRQSMARGPVRSEDDSQLASEARDHGVRWKSSGRLTRLEKVSHELPRT